ncbi:hypothetical protein OC842_004370 [Tilletia horrida]|uniref:BD-FAE-like domain-containing protein n=1 Tax=Tilletia horrida TaxID=155126 RepID=A0AAN6GA08_9BASI|nr:hypothetical protein OC842_004370 [Tilletia horrida]
MSGQASSRRQLLQIPYLPNAQQPAQTIDLFLPERNSSSSSSSRRPAGLPRLFIFIHGGAWRSGDNTELHPLALSLTSSSSSSNNIAVALINYRLSPAPKDLLNAAAAASAFHPAHIQDVHAALRYLLLERPAGQEAKGQQHEYSTDRVVLGGHSVGAWLAASVMLDPSSSSSSSSPPLLPTPTPTPTPTSSNPPPPPPPPPPSHTPLHPPTLRAHIHTYLLLDGIYDLDALLDEYPAYNAFVAQAFEAPLGQTQPLPSQRRYARVSMTGWTLAPSYASGSMSMSGSGSGSEQTRLLPHIRIVHSRADELLSLRQPELAREHLTTLLKERIPTQSTHDLLPHYLQVDYDSVPGGHFELLGSHQLVTYIRALFA